MLPCCCSPAALPLPPPTQRLRDSGARMYGAFWCSHCYDQKQAFGAEAMAAFPYVECYPEGLHKVGGRALHAAWRRMAHAGCCAAPSLAGRWRGC